MGQFDLNKLAELDALAEKATPGPWRQEGGLYMTSDHCPLCNTKRE